MRFIYTAINAKQKKSHGLITADDKRSAMEKLLLQGLNALELKDEEAALSIGRADLSFLNRDIGSSDIHKAKIKPKKLLALLNQMSIMMKSGVTLSLALDVLIQSEKDKTVKAILDEVHSDLFNGSSLSQAMEKFTAFPKLVVSMIKAGEENGRLDAAFEKCSSIVAKEISIKAKIHSAMVYPAIVLSLVVGLIIIMNTLVLPNFISIFSQFGAELPAITKMVMAISDFIINKWYMILGVILAAVISYKCVKKYSAPAAYAMDKMKLSSSPLGMARKQVLTSRLCYVTSSLLEAGVNIISSLSIARDVISNLYMKDIIDKIINDIKTGSQIHTAVSRHPFFDAIFISMIRIGEESGMLEDSLKKMAKLYEEESDETVKRIITMLEPMLTIVIALIVGTVMISIVMPMFGMYSIIK